MPKLSMTWMAGAALAVMASIFLLRSHEAVAQTTPPAAPPAAAASQAMPAAKLVSDATAFYVNVVDLEISPPSMAKFMADLSEDVKGTLSETGVREIDSNVAQKNPNHVFIFEIYNDPAAWNAHQKTTTYAKFVGLTMMMIKNYNIRPFTSLSLNASGSVQPATGPLYVNVEEFDISPDQYDHFVDAAKAEAAGAVKDPGVREFNVAASTNTKNHVLLFEVYDNAAALEAEMATDGYKAYQAKTKTMVVKSTVTPYSSVSLNTKAP